MKDKKANFTIEEVSTIFSEEQKFEPYYAGTYKGKTPINIFPKRANYYGLAICLKGNIEMTANLERYQLKPRSLIVMPPEIIRTWKGDLKNYEEETLLFSESLFEDTRTLKAYRFFDSNSTYVTSLNKEEVSMIYSLIQEIKKITNSESTRKIKIVTAYITIILNLLADYYDKYHPVIEHKQTAPLQLEHHFKKLLIENYNKIRSVREYADLLHISSKHLSETMKQNTGKTAGEWIKEYIILEAKVQLKESHFSVRQIADLLQFSDVNVFSKYFKKNTGFTPGNYRKLSRTVGGA